MTNIFESMGQITEESEISEKLLKSFDDMTRNYNYADWQYEKIMEQIRNFEQTLDDNHELAIQLVSFNSSKVMAVHEISYQNPNLLYFYGTIDNAPAQLIQHINQLSFLLLATPKENPDKSPPEDCARVSSSWQIDSAAYLKALKRSDFRS